MSWLDRRRGTPGTSAGTSSRALTASGRRVDLSTSTRAPASHRTTGTSWQSDAWAYRDGIGEVRFAVDFLRNSVAKARLFPAIADVDADQPTPLHEAEGVPADVVAAATDALARLSAGTATWGQLLAPLAENFEVPGEAMLVGRPDPDDPGAELWEVRSTSEVVPGERGGWQLVEGEGARNGIPLDDETCYVARLWQPHARYRSQADSPMRSLLDPCEELLATSRLVRSHAKSRIAMNGVLAISHDLDFAAGTPGMRTPAERLEAEYDTDADPFFVDFVNAATAAIADESSPSAVLPMVLRGSAEALEKGLKFLELARTLDPELVKRIDGALRRIGQGLDVPPEIITGVADVNHWNAWAIDDSTVRHHTEPLVARMVDALTAGFLRAQLTAYGVDPVWARRIVVWYDLSALATRPNRAEDAKIGHERGVLSDAALAAALGFDPDVDMPTPAELLRRAALNRGTIDGSITEALLRSFVDPGVDNARHLMPGMVTVRNGVDAQDAERDNPPASVAAAGTPGTPDIVDAEEDPAIDAPPADDTPSGETPGPTTGLPAAVTSAGGRVLRAYVRESRRLAQLDRDLREGFAVAADTAVERALERAGNRIRSQANRDPDARTAAAGVPGRLVASTLGESLVAGLGLDADTLLDGSFDDLARRWDTTTTTAGDEAVALAARIRGIDTSTPAGQAEVDQLRAALADSTAQAWPWLLAGLTAVTMSALYDPDVDITDAAGAAATVDAFGEDPGRSGRIVSLVRGALALAGGLPPTAEGITPDGVSAGGTVGLQGISGGDHLRTFLAAGDVAPAGYEWVYGISRRPFVPHRNLDGTVFAEYGHPVLTNTDPSGWPSSTLAPGDHRGCHCDAQIVYADGTRTSDTLDAIGVESYDPAYLNILRDVAATDTAVGLTGTTPQQIVAEADRIANVRPSRRG